MNLHTPLSEIMTKKIYKAQEYDTMEQVSKIFEKYDVHHVPVVNDEENLVGIISKSDFLKISFGMSLFSHPEKDSYNRALYKTLLVKEVMTKMVVSLTPKDSVEVAAGIFRENIFHALPIVEDHKLVGIVTTFDLLNFAFRPDDYASIEGKAYINTLD